ncbi:helix-turn-helix domain-containing protein [Pedobacter cryoconitis]|uniref:Helix-turn-helix protein n=1 Tax=Pedobacter cryoconitis TaxID=188932 RepID=A0A327T9B2_9SPHI|nr:helix-turn-helix transcriptional regulator [Pedobacter cryoconitis]RAJ36965.1 helix-turn-helix protein [Pedobacter cryoconitis]
MAENDKSALKEYGNRVRTFRKEANISQEALATFAQLYQSYIASIEKGDVNIGILAQQTLSNTFGVKHYQLSDPDFPIPPKSVLRENIRRYITARNIDTAYLKDKLPNYVKPMDELLQSGFFNEPKTTKEIAEQYKNEYELEISPSRVVDILSRGTRKDKIDIIKSACGTRNKYKLTNQKNHL